MKIDYKFVTLTVILLICVNPSSAISKSDFKVAFVTHVYDYNKYIPRINVYKPGDDMKLYVGVENVNRGRAAAVDFVIIVKDPNDYTVCGKVVKKRITGYVDEIFDTISLKVDDSWVDGKYKIEAYAFDVLDSDETYRNYNEIYYKLISGEGDYYSLSVETVSRKVAPFVMKELTFYVRSHSSLPNQFIIFNPRFEATRLPVGAPNVLKVTVANTLDVKGDTEIKVLVDGKVVDDKKVELKGYEIKEVSFEIPPLKIGRHLICVRAENSIISGNLPIIIKKLIYKKSILVGDVLNGTMIYLPNNYVLGSAGISEVEDLDVKKALKNLESPSLNRESARKMITNVLAYIYLENSQNYKKGIRVALLEGSDERAGKILPKLLEIIRRESGAPVTYKGLREYDNLSDVDVAFYVGCLPEVEKLRYFFERGGVLIVDNPLYWMDCKGRLSLESLTVGGWKNVSTPKRIFYSFYQLDAYSGIWVNVTKEIKIPPKIVYYNLSIDKFITSVGEPVKVSFKIRNEGKTGSVDVKVLINGETVYERKVTLKSGEERLISFEYTPTIEGSYRVEIPGTGLVKVFFAKAKTPVTTPTPTQTSEKREGSVFIVVSAVILTALIIARILLRD